MFLLRPISKNRVGNRHLSAPFPALRTVPNRQTAVCSDNGVTKRLDINKDDDDWRKLRNRVRILGDIVATCGHTRVFRSYAQSRGVSRFELLHSYGT